MQELNELNEGDELHITLDDGQTVTLTVAGSEKHTAWLNYNGQEYAKMSNPVGVEEDYILRTLHTEEVGRHGVESFEVA